MPVETPEYELSPQEIEFLNAIFDVARAGQVAKMTSLLDQGIPVDFTNSNGDTLLILAAYHQHPELVKLLIERQAELNRLNDRGQTALVCAVFRNNATIAQMLLDAGADTRAGNQTPGQVAEFFQLDDMIKLLEKG